MAILLLTLALILLLVCFSLLGLPLLVGNILLPQKLLLCFEPASGTPLSNLLVQGGLLAGEGLIPILGPNLPLFLDIDHLAPLFL